MPYGQSPSVHSTCSSLMVTRLALGLGIWLALHGCTPAQLTPELAGEAAPILRGTGQRLALLVGISHYPQNRPLGITPWKQLHSQDDVAALRDVLSRRYGFADQDIMTLEDGAATADGIRVAFRKHLIDRAKPGAVVVFHFSGHGQQVLDNGNDELDGLDETLVPANAIDQRASSGALVNLRDDEIGTWLGDLQTRMHDPSGHVQGSINVFLDTCHSGTATRGDLVERGRGWDEQLDGPLPAAADHRGEPAQRMLDQEGEYVLLSAARSDQSAKEDAGMGAFTRALVGALWRASSQTTYRSLREEILAVVQARDWNQSPQLEGKPDQLLFGGAAPPPQPYVRVEWTREHPLTLAAGALQLVTVGSIYTLHQAGSEAMDDTTAIGQAEVVQTEPARSILRLLVDPTGRIPTALQLRAARAVERVRSYKDRQLRVFIADRSIPRALQKAVRELPLVTEKGFTVDSYDLKLTQVGDHLELHRPESGCPVAQLPLGGRTSAEVITALCARLEGEWRWRQLYDLRHAEPAVQATLQLVPVLGQLDAAGHLQVEPTRRTDLTPSAELRLTEGELFTLELHNPTPNSLWVTVLGLDPHGDIQVLFPKSEQPDDGLIKPGTTQVSSHYVFQTERPLGLSIYKVIATRQQVDFSGLVQQAVELGRGAQSGVNRGTRLAELTARTQTLSPEVSPLAQLLIHAAAGSQRTGDAGLPLSSWGVSEGRVEVVAERGSGGNRDNCAE